MKNDWQSAWIVGASSGFGRELALRLSRNRTITFVSARREDVLHELCDENSNMVPITLDVTNQEECAAALKEIVEQNDVLPDLIILNAAVYVPMNLDSFDVNLISNMNAVNYMGIVNMVSALSHYLPAKKLCTVVAVTSPSGWRGLPGGLGYGSSKAAVINLFESLKPEMDQQNVDLRLINPGFIRTRLTDKNEFEMPQLMTPEQAADFALKGLETDKFDISFPNPFILKLRLLKLLPNSLYFRLMKKISQKKEAR